MIDRDERDQAERDERQQAKAAAAQFRKDVQEAMSTAGGRRVLAAFLAAASVDHSPLRADALTTGHAIGWQDAAGWWLNQLRAHCPEREGQMRAEARRDARTGHKETDDE